MHPDKKLNIVFWAFPSWNGNYMKSTVELARELAVNHNVLYIDYAYTVKDVLFPKPSSLIPVKRITGKEESIIRVSTGNGGSIWVLSLPPIIPFNWTSSKWIYNFLEAFNNSIVKARIKKALHKLNFKTDIAVNAFNPFFGNAMSSIFSNCPIIYYCYDNIDASNWASTHGARLEKSFINRADAVIFSSAALQQNKQAERPSYVINNGVDLRIFNNVTAAENPARPVIGYCGSIDERLDYDLTEKVIACNPQYDFQFIGRIVAEQSMRLSDYPNVHFTGALNPQALPGMMKHFSVGIIPFLKTSFTKNIYPMKVNEYLALGIPVVSTGFAQLSDLLGLMEIADDTETFSEKLKEVIATNNGEKQQVRINKARENSWQSKASEFEKILIKYAA
jgi:glycosyltransferase involved in cell wall biosynthesis